MALRSAMEDPPPHAEAAWGGGGGGASWHCARRESARRAMTSARRFTWRLAPRLLFVARSTNSHPGRRPKMGSLAHALVEAHWQVLSARTHLAARQHLPSSTAALSQVFYDYVFQELGIHLLVAAHPERQIGAGARKQLRDCTAYMICSAFTIHGN